jgi:hypothetical protein
MEKLLGGGEESEGEDEGGGAWCASYRTLWARLSCGGSEGGCPIFPDLEDPSSSYGKIVAKLYRHRRKGFVFAAGKVLLLLCLAMFTWHSQRRTARSSKRRDRHPDSHGKNQSAVHHFPSLNDTLEMAQLSLLVYTFRFEVSDETACQRIRSGNFTMPGSSTSSDDRLPGRQVFPDLECFWFKHDRTGEGTQVMLVSSALHNHLTVVFAGTDNLQTSLVDTDVRWEAFGGGDEDGKKDDDEEDGGGDDDDDNQYHAGDLLPSDMRVHSGFDHTVFRNGMYNEISRRLGELRQNDTYAQRRLFVTGHSLGAAAAVLTSLALTEEAYFAQHVDPAVAATEVPLSHHWYWPFSKWHRHHHGNDDDDAARIPPKITSINFGCPRIGNYVFRNLWLARPHVLEHLHVWRVVLGWDLVPRLPEFFQHNGHTIQIETATDKTAYTSTEKSHPDDIASSASSRHDVRLTDPRLEDTATWMVDNDGKNKSSHVALAYYQHYGNESLGYSGVPLGWSSLPYMWLPGALSSHHIARYRNVLQAWKGAWIEDFVTVDDGGHTEDDDAKPVDDDFWSDPPFDDFPGVLAVA